MTANEIAHDVYAATGKGETLKLQRSIVLPRTAAHTNKLRALITEVELMGERDEDYSIERVEKALQAIESEIDHIRIIHRDWAGS